MWGKWLVVCKRSCGVGKVVMCKMGLGCGGRG